MEYENQCCKTQRTLEEESRGKSRFINLTRDYGFKIVMADENHPELMLGFLNAVIPERKIVSIRFLNTEQLTYDEEDHRSNYDVLCIDSEGNRFLTEMQKEPYDCFADRLAVYAGGQTSRLLKRGEPYDKVRTLYVISVLGGYLKVKDEKTPNRDALLRRAGMRMLDSGKTLMDKENFIFLQLPAAKEPSKDSAFIEKWAWYVREMVNYKEKPEGLDSYFDLLFNASSRQNIEQGKLSIYDKMVRDEIQIAAEREYAVREGRAEAREEGREEGRAEGRAEEKLEMAKKLKAAGVDIDTVCQCTGLSIEEIRAL